MEFLTLEQQADIARTTREFDEDMLTIADQAAEKGLTFATGARSRVLAEERRGTQFEDVIQSTRRKRNLQTEELKLKASRGDIQAQEQLADIEAKGAFQLQNIGRAATTALGSLRAPALAGFEKTGFQAPGGVLGDIEQERRKSIIEAGRLGLPKK
jgi:hypothetical protein